MDDQDMFVMSKAEAAKQRLFSQFGTQYMLDLRVEHGVIVMRDSYFSCCVLGFITINDGWIWAWAHDKNLDGPEVRKIYNGLPEKLQTSDRAEFESKMGVMLLIAHIQDVGGFDYIINLPYPIADENGGFLQVAMTMGIKSIPAPPPAVSESAPPPAQDTVSWADAQCFPQEPQEPANDAVVEKGCEEKFEKDLKKDDVDLKKDDVDLKKDDVDLKKDDVDLKKDDVDLKKDDVDLKKNEKKCENNCEKDDLKKDDVDLKKNEKKCENNCEKDDLKKDEKKCEKKCEKDVKRNVTERGTKKNGKKR
jgi:hypothetical protein